MIKSQAGERRFRLLILVSTLVLKPTEAASNVGQAEADTDVVTTVAASGPQADERLVGVVEPGRLLNIFLGGAVVLGFLVLNSMAIIALGLTGTVSPARRNNRRRTRRPVPVTLIEARSSHVIHRRNVIEEIDHFIASYKPQ